MTVDAQIAATLRQIILTKATNTIDAADIGDETPLDSLGLDSIAIAEVLLECERHFGIAPAELLDDEAVTIRRLVAHAKTPVS